uniref:Uncharacterized protein n=1 Tax=Cacopsylla melanoneura TaxID=428564 RepID=A0A8D9B741_9HEMI
MNTFLVLPCLAFSKFFTFPLPSPITAPSISPLCPLPHLRRIFYLSLPPSFPNLLVLTPQSLSLFLIQILLHLFYPCFDCPSSLVLTSRASRYSSLIFNFFFSPDVRLLLSVGSEKLKMYPSTKFGGRVLF